MESAAPLPGTQDLLFEAAKRLRRCEEALRAVFEKAGYAEVIPPAIEGADVFGAEAFRALDKSGKLLALRSDFTAQVARIAATRLAGQSPLRLWYRGSVVRRDREAVYERVQAGCELVGAPGAEADAEILALAAASLKALGLTSARISLGSTGYFEAVARAAGVSERLAQALHDAVDRKDLPTLRGLCEREVPPGKARDALLMLAQPPRPQTQAKDLLERARAAAPSDEALAALQRIQDVLSHARGAELLEVDLGEVRGLGYYTGVVFNLYATGAPRPVGGGGRYDTLLGRFGDPRPAVGFSLDLDALVPLAC